VNCLRVRYKNSARWDKVFRIWELTDIRVVTRVRGLGIAEGGEEDLSPKGLEITGSNCAKYPTPVFL